MNLLVAVLTSRDVEKLKRCIESVLPQTNDVVVVCNTLDFSFVEQAQQLAESYGIQCIITESNGNPGKGKNSVKDYFLSTEFTHLIPVDGDDMLLPKSIQIISNIVKSRNPDVIGLIDSLVLLDGKELPIVEWQEHEVLFQRSVDLTEPNNLKRLNIHTAKIRRVATQYNNFFNRFVLLSRKAASHIDYYETLTGAEDIKQSLLFKLMQKEGKIDYILLSSKNIYLYDVTDVGACFAVCKCDLSLESKFFWDGISKEQISSIQSLQLERLYD